LVLISLSQIMSRTSVAAAILAGGQARRLGGAVKSLLMIEGTRIIDRQLEALRQVADPIVIVAADSAPFAPLGLDTLPDIVPGCGPLGGIYTALTHSSQPRTLVVAGDMPCLPPALLARLVLPSDADVVVPRSARGYEPLCAVYAARCAEPIRQRLARGTWRVTELLDGVRVEEIGPEMLAVCDPRGLLSLNVNTPHDYERALEVIARMSAEPAERITDNQSSS
jgi:molybdopterin-guanine dinucleotide biosynthesis protein A